jgi:hypothetical protein
MRAFDLLSRSEFDIRSSSQPRHQFEMALVKWIHLRQLTPLADIIGSLETGRPMSTAPGAPARPSFAPPARPTAPPVKPAAPAVKPAASPVKPAGSSVKPVAPAAARPTPAPTPVPPPGPAPEAPRTESQAPSADVKSALLSSIRESNKTFYSMVLAQAQKIEIEGNTIVFTFAPVHKSLRTQLEGRKAWVEQMAQTAAGRRLAVVVRESAPVATATGGAEDAAAAKRAELTARAKAEPAVQAVLDVFGGEIEDVEELDKS